MIFGGVFSNIENLVINNEPIVYSTCVKYLGIFIQHNLKFDKHMSHLTSTLSRINGLFYSIKNQLPLECLIKLYHAFVSPHLNLHMLTWGSAPPSSLGPLQVAQNKIVRNIYRYCSTAQIYSRTNLLNIQNLYNY